MAIKKYNPQDFQDQVIELKDKDWSDWHSKNTIIFASLLQDGLDWGREEWTAYNLSPEALAIIRPRLNRKIEERFFFRETGTVPFKAFKMHLKTRLEAAVTKRGWLYQETFNGIDFSFQDLEKLKRREIESDYPAAQLMTEQKDYATSAEEEAYEKTFSRASIPGLLQFIQAAGEPDEEVLEDIDVCFSQIQSFNF